MAAKNKLPKTNKNHISGAEEKDIAMDKGRQIHAVLRRLYPEAVCSLLWQGDPWKLLVMGVLSAQCTDQRVNQVCPSVFERFPLVTDMAATEPHVLEPYIRSCGFGNTKAAHLVLAARRIVEIYGGQVPMEMEDLLSLPGVGRKIANLVRGDAFHLPGIVADTHCIRLNGRFGFYPETCKDPLKVEKILDSCIPKAEQSDYCHRMVLLGREYCTAKSPRCPECPLQALCQHGLAAESL